MGNKPKALSALLLLYAGTVHATVRCHIIYGGENFTVEAVPTANAYRVPVTPIGRYFAFRATQVDTPARVAAINTYTYSVVSGEPVLLHQAKHRPPFIQGGSRYGFTGLNFVYEPSKASELEYWCEQLPGKTQP
jgi:hypothetical protein